MDRTRNYKYDDDTEVEQKLDLIKKVKRLPEVSEFYRFINSNALREEAVDMLKNYIETVE